MNYGTVPTTSSSLAPTDQALPDSLIETIVDGGYLPEFVLRRGIQGQLQQRINLIKSTSLAESYETKMKYVELLRSRPIAIETATANEQHYEVGTGVLTTMLGPRMKYSSCLYPKGSETLAQAEIAMLESYVEKAQLKDGMRMFDLGYVKTLNTTHSICRAHI